MNDVITGVGEKWRFVLVRGGSTSRRYTYTTLCTPVFFAFRRDKSSSVAVFEELQAAVIEERVLRKGMCNHVIPFHESHRE